VQDIDETLIYANIEAVNYLPVLEVIFYETYKAKLGWSNFLTLIVGKKHLQNI
jgi:hypothetical protein